MIPRAEAAVWLAVLGAVGAAFLTIRARYRPVWEATLSNARATAWLDMPNTATGWLARWAPIIAPLLTVAFAGSRLWAAGLLAAVSAVVLVASLEHHRRTRLVSGRDQLRSADPELERLAFWTPALLGVVFTGLFAALVLALNGATATELRTCAAYGVIAAGTIPYAPAVAHWALDAAMPTTTRSAVVVTYLSCLALLVLPKLLETATGLLLAGGLSAATAAVSELTRRRCVRIRMDSLRALQVARGAAPRGGADA